MKLFMKILPVLILTGILTSASADDRNAPAPAAGASTATMETIVCIRHGEKPKAGLGQLTCRGLNRALALPDVLLAKYGRPGFVFAPNPAEKVDGVIGYNYIRPLMTIEPTAIRCGLPVNTKFGYLEIGDLERELEKPEYRSATVFVAWEHTLLDEFAKKIVKDSGGDVKQVPDWPGKDYDTIFVFKITRKGDSKSIAFSIDHEGLDGLSDDCPGPARALKEKM
jgi:hypothetical protein